MIDLMDRYRAWRDEFQKAIDERFYSLEYLDGLVWSGRAQFWSTDEAAIIAELKVYPGGAVVIEGVIAAGELDGIRKLIVVAEAWGRLHGAGFAKIESRLGWLRALKDDGYELWQTALVKEL